MPPLARPSRDNRASSASSCCCSKSISRAGELPWRMIVCSAALSWSSSSSTCRRVCNAVNNVFIKWTYLVFRTRQGGGEKKEKNLHVSAANAELPAERAGADGGEHHDGDDDRGDDGRPLQLRPGGVVEHQERQGARLARGEQHDGADVPGGGDARQQADDDEAQ